MSGQEGGEGGVGKTGTERVVRAARGDIKRLLSVVDLDNYIQTCGLYEDAWWALRASSCESRYWLAQATQSLT